MAAQNIFYRSIAASFVWLINWLERIHPAVLIFVILCFNCLSFVPASNEEQYLLLARQHFNPDWLPASFSANEFPGARLLFEWLTGWAVDSFGFEHTVFWGRFLNFLLLSFPLAAIFRHLQFSNITVLVLLQVFLLTGQNFYAGEWIFRSMEAKTFAYVFVFWGLLKFLKNRKMQAVLLMVAATYFHVLVGGWFAVSCFGMMFLQRTNWQKFLLLGTIYTMLCLPLIIYLAKAILVEVPLQDVNLDYVYVYFRNKHHIGLFYSYDIFCNRHAPGIALALAAFIYFVRMRLPESSPFQILKQLILVMIGIGLLFVGLSLIDKIFLEMSGKMLLKFYPFRMQGMALFCCFILLAYVLKTRLTLTKVQRLFIVSLLVVAALFTTVYQGLLQVQQMMSYQKDTAYNEVIDFAKNRTSKEELFLFYGFDDGEEQHSKDWNLDFIRRTERDLFVEFKFVPGGTDKLYEWYRRIQLVEQLSKDPDQITSFAKQHHISFILTPRSLDLELPMAFENERFRVYKI